MAVPPEDSRLGHHWRWLAPSCGQYETPDADDLYGDDGRKKRPKAFTVDGETYKRRCLVPVAARMQAMGSILVQDGAKVHWTPGNRRYLESKKIGWLNGYPASTPQLNPIENVWSLMQAKVSDRGPSDRESLLQFLQEEWQAYPQSTLDRMVLSFEDRLERCVQTRGRM
jgi:phage terminase large subunit GpA-like protein